ncbi:hypothetical protein TSUD_193390 [Trifolium subterraneum]|uniref:Uncharacterized protein n=1 Tax=Trifolium subterraneum TaxID=3900 RepID=A0A2Z6LRE6_TRISU|nr:hypothetical protein TSUD_193390 [Trifolium subterraneum]
MKFELYCEDILYGCLGSILGLDTSSSKCVFEYALATRLIDYEYTITKLGPRPEMFNSELWNL